jgi:hypothetical protein
MLQTWRRDAPTHRSARRVSIRVVTILVILLGLPPAVQAEVSVDGRAMLFYTDDVGIFSATRRLSRDGDPTQPALDSRLTDKGSDVVFEPDVTIGKAFISRYGTTTVDARGQGFIFTDDTRFTHGTLRLQAVHAFSPETRFRLRYYYAPNLFLGDNEERRSGTEAIVGETVTSHIWSSRIERELKPGLDVRLLARYGLRRYNEEFSQRDTNFWTIGPHLNWQVHPRVKFGVSYHYERGLADGRHQPQFKDDVSYINHYVSVDLDIELMERLTLMTAFHYERNNWTSGIPEDERNGAHENVYQGEVLLVRHLNEAVRIFVGVQRSSRKQSFESESVKNTNVGAGVAALF